MRPTVPGGTWPGWSGRKGGRWCPPSAVGEAWRRADEMICIPRPGFGRLMKRLIHAMGKIIQDDGETNCKM